MKKNYKKFDLISIIIVVATLIGLGVGALMLGNFATEFGTDLQDTAQEDYGASDNVNASVDFIANDSQQYADNYFFWFLVAVFIGIIMMGLYLEFEPATMIIIFIVGLIVVAGSWLGGSIYSGFQEEIDNSAGMTKTNVLLNPSYFPIFILTCLIILVIIMYNRKNPSNYQ